MNLLVRNFDETARLKLDFMMRDFLVMELSEIFKSSSMMQWRSWIQTSYAKLEWMVQMLI